LKKKILIFTVSMGLLSSSCAQALTTYGQKFLITTLGSCAAGGAAAYAYAEGTGYDTQPRTSITFLGAATGCITGALFSYFFYDDNSAVLKTQIEAQQQTISELSNQIARLQGSSDPNFDVAKGVLPSFPNPFDNLNVSEGVAKKEFDPSNLPAGLNLKNCNRLYQFTLKSDGNSLDIGKGSQDIVAVSKNFALVGFTFLYTPNSCFAPSSGNSYAGAYFPGLENYLFNRVKNWNAEHSGGN